MLGRKFDNAIILASCNRLYSVPIRHRLTQDTWMAKIEGQDFVFRYDAGSVYIRASESGMPARVLFYDMRHWSPFRPYVSGLANIVDDLGIERLPYAGVEALREHALTGDNPEPRDGDGKPKPLHVLSELPETGLHGMEQYSPETYARINQWVGGLQRREIFHPIAHVSAELDRDIADADSGFMGRSLADISPDEKQLEKRQNKPVGAKKAWTRLAVAMLALGLTAGGIWWAYDKGWIEFADQPLDVILPAPVEAPDECSGASLAAKYPDPLDLRIAQTLGTETCPIPREIQMLADEFSPELVSWAMHERGLEVPTPRGVEVTVP